MERFFPPAQIPGGIDAPVFVRASMMSGHAGLGRGLGGAHCTGSIGTTTPSAASTTSPASRHRSSRKRGARICTPGRRRPVVADRHRKRRNPQQRANVAMIKAGGKCSGLSATALREVARKCRLPNPQGELLTLARRYERRADYLLSKYAADDRG